MSNKTILLLLAFVTTATVGGVGVHYGTDFLRGEPEARLVDAETDVGEVKAGGLARQPVEAAPGEAESEAAEDPGDAIVLQSAPREPAVPSDGAEEASPVAPSFDVIRVEPTGEFMVAGRAAPNAEVEIMLGSETLVSEQANNAGEWAVVPEQPLPVGRHDLRLRSRVESGGEGATDGDRAAIIIDEEGGMPLVALTRPGEATEVVQRWEDTGLSEGAASAEAGDGRSGAPDGPADEPDTASADLPSLTDEDGGPARVSEASEASDTAGAGEGEIEALAALPDDGGETPALQPSPSVSGSTVVAIDVVEVEDADRLYLAGRTAPGADVRLYVNEEHLGDTRANDEGAWSRTGERSLPPGRYTVRADIVDDVGDVQARAEVHFDRVRVAAAEEAVASEADAPASEIAPSRASETAGGGEESVNIERGDNLWRIARQVYGEGVRYTVIYEANRSQIRDPDLIFPGQIFTIPLPDAAGE